MIIVFRLDLGFGKKRKKVTLMVRIVHLIKVNFIDVLLFLLDVIVMGV